MESSLAPQSVAQPASPTVPVIAEHIGIRPGYCGGRPHILGHRIKVDLVATWHVQMGMSPAEIVADYPTITLDDVHAALAYYYDHREEVEAQREEDERFVEQLKASSPSPLREKIRRSDAANDPLSPG